MNIIIVGCGKIGGELAERLNEEGNNITVIDTIASKVNDLSSRFDVMGVIGNGATHSTLIEADVKRADLLIAVTGSDELNLLCCMIAKKVGGCNTIARVRNPDYFSEVTHLKDELGLAMIINPEQAAAAEIARVLRFPSAVKIDTFAKGKVELMKFRIPEGSPLTDCAVKEIITKLHCDVLVCTVERGDEVFIANGDFKFKEKDLISIISSPKNANNFFRTINYKINPVKDALIVGGGEISFYLTEMLQKSGIKVKVVEKNPKRCEELLDFYGDSSDVSILCGDGVDKELLLEEGLETSGGFISLTNLDEENILLSLFAKSVSKGKLITKINRIDFDEVIAHLDLDTIVYPKRITAEIITRYVRALKNSIGSNVETLYNVIQGKVEAAEFRITDDSEITGKPLSELHFIDGVLIATILRGKKVIIPRGGDMIMKGDSVVVVSNHLALHDITDILK